VRALPALSGARGGGAPRCLRIENSCCHSSFSLYQPRLLTSLSLFSWTSVPAEFRCDAARMQARDHNAHPSAHTATPNPEGHGAQSCNGWCRHFLQRFSFAADALRAPRQNVEPGYKGVGWWAGGGGSNAFNRAREGSASLLSADRRGSWPAGASGSAPGARCGCCLRRELVPNAAPAIFFWY
jgi:hypothetical protein